MSFTMADMLGWSRVHEALGRLDWSEMLTLKQMLEKKKRGGLAVQLVTEWEKIHL